MTHGQDGQEDKQGETRLPHLSAIRTSAFSCPFLNSACTGRQCYHQSAPRLASMRRGWTFATSGCFTRSATLHARACFCRCGADATHRVFGSQKVIQQLGDGIGCNGGHGQVSHCWVYIDVTRMLAVSMHAGRCARGSAQQVVQVACVGGVAGRRTDGPADDHEGAHEPGAVAAHRQPVSGAHGLLQRQ